jgi:2-polyprenyl-3-methyl-5-hydroxy-6-metoxy-1,4-benzoquinol methylase
MPEGFDRYAADYEALLADSVRASGEGPDYFAEYKCRVLLRTWRAPTSGAEGSGAVLDYGCGTGLLTKHLAAAYASREVHGYDPSGESIAHARERVPSATFFDDESSLGAGRYGAIVVANVLHHVPVAERRPLLARITALLQPGGSLFVFEHNPLNPLTRRAVAACKFDDDAILLGPLELPRLLRDAGLSRVRRDFIVFFPHALARLRALEPALASVPLGAQMFAQGVRAQSVTASKP